MNRHAPPKKKRGYYTALKETLGKSYSPAVAAQLWRALEREGDRLWEKYEHTGRQRKLNAYWRFAAAAVALLEGRPE
jgi:hypothetical protein